MKFSILYLLAVTLCVALGIQTFVARKQVNELQKEVFDKENELKLATPFISPPSLELLRHQHTVCKAVLAEYDISPDSTRFLPPIATRDTNPSLYFDDPNVARLCRCITLVDRVRLEQLIRSGVNVNNIGKGGVTPLFWALCNKNPSAFYRLLDAGADPDIRLTDYIGDGNYKGQYAAPGTNVLFQCLNQRQLPHSTGFSLALARTGNINQRHFGGTTLLMLYCMRSSQYQASLDLQIVNQLLQAGVDVNAQDDKGKTALHYSKSRPALCMKLMDAGADPFIKDNHEADLSDLVETIWKKDQHRRSGNEQHANSEPNQHPGTESSTYDALRLRLIKMRDTNEVDSSQLP